MKPSTTLVIPDAHAEPGHSNERFDALGNFIIEKRPDTIVQIGDFLTMDSISHYSRDVPRLREGKRIADDIAAGQDAYDRMMLPWRTHNAKRVAQKRKQYSPQKIWFWANHEDRARQYVDLHPELEGFVPEGSLLPVEEDGWEVHGYKEFWFHKGVAFTHVPVNSGNNQPICGKYVTRRALDLSNASVVFGHTHAFGTASVARTSEEGRRYTEAVNVGWFGDYQPDYIEGHATVLGWWSGLVLLHQFEHGRFDVERISIERVKEKYL